jgi:hypothetical protein
MGLGDYSSGCYWLKQNPANFPGRAGFCLGNILPDFCTKCVNEVHRRHLVNTLQMADWRLEIVYTHKGCSFSDKRKVDLRFIPPTRDGACTKFNLLFFNLRSSIFSMSIICKDDQSKKHSFSFRDRYLKSLLSKLN